MMVHWFMSDICHLIKATRENSSKEHLKVHMSFIIQSHRSMESTSCGHT